MHDSSDGRSMTGRKDTDGFCLHIGTFVIACVKPDQFDGGFSGELLNQPACHEILYLISGKNVHASLVLV